MVIIAAVVSSLVSVQSRSYFSYRFITEITVVTGSTLLSAMQTTVLFCRDVKQLYSGQIHLIVNPQEIRRFQRTTLRQDTSA